MNQYKSFTISERPDLVNEISILHGLGWSKFMLQDEVANQYFGYLPKVFPHLQFVLLDQDEKAIACGNAVSFHWDGTVKDLPSGWDDVLKRSVEESKKGIRANTVSAIAIVVNPLYRGKSISELMVRRMKEIVKEHDYQYMLAPVRPSLKHKYPLIPMEQYAYWVTNEGQAFDPWIRIHLRTNANILSIANESMIIKGKISQWEQWIGLSLPVTGKYIVPEALVPISVNRERDCGEYIEPNVWIQHIL
ncbi:GNAT family N-acetyltransferase [Bacillus sp. AK128]